MRHGDLRATLLTNFDVLLTAGEDTFLCFCQKIRLDTLFEKLGRTYRVSVVS